MTSPVTEGAPQIGDPLAGLIGPRQEDYPAGQLPARRQGSQIVYSPMLPTADGCYDDQRYDHDPDARRVLRRLEVHGQQLT